MATTDARNRARAGETWLLSCAPDPSRVRRCWADEDLAPISSGSHWRVAETGLLRSVAAMKRIGSERLGPVLADLCNDRAWWLLPPNLGDELDDVRHLTVHPVCWRLLVPPVRLAVDDRAWLERPDGSGRLTDPTLLGAALGPGGYRLATEASA